MTYKNSTINEIPNTTGQLPESLLEAHSAYKSLMEQCEKYSSETLPETTSIAKIYNSFLKTIDLLNNTSLYLLENESIFNKNYTKQIAMYTKLIHNKITEIIKDSDLDKILLKPHIYSNN